MAWMAPAATLAGGALGLLGSDDPPKFRPFKEAAAQFRPSNPNRVTPFGSVEYRVDDGGTPDRFRDDTYNMVQTYSPEMNGLLDVMMGIAGRSPGSYQSYMPEGLTDKLSEVYGSEVQPSQYTPPEFAFGYDGSPAQARANDPMQGGQRIAYEAQAGDTTNRELVSQAYEMGDISGEDYRWFQRLFGETNDNFSGPDATGWASGPDSATLKQYLDNLTPRNRQRMEGLFDDLYEDGNFRNYEDEAMNRLVEASSGQS